MPILNINKTYADGSVLNESDLDNIKDSIETFVNTTKLDADNLQDSGVTNAKLSANSVSTAKIQNDAVTADKLASDAVVTSSIQNNAVTSLKLANNLITSISSDTVLTDNDNVGIVLATSGSDGLTLTLPTAADNSNRRVTIKKVDSGTSPVTIAGEVGETIDGASDFDLPAQYMFVELLCDGSDWNIINKDLTTEWASWSPSLNITGGGSLSASNVVYARYRRQGKQVEFVLDVDGITIASTGGPITFTLPVNATSTLTTNSQSIGHGVCNIGGAGGVQQAVARMDGSNQNIAQVQGEELSSFTVGSSRTFNITGSYETE